MRTKLFYGKYISVIPCERHLSIRSCTPRHTCPPCARWPCTCICRCLARPRYSGCPASPRRMRSCRPPCPRPSCRSPRPGLASCTRRYRRRGLGQAREVPLGAQSRPTCVDKLFETLILISNGYFLTKGECYEEYQANGNNCFHSSGFLRLCFCRIRWIYECMVLKISHKLKHNTTQTKMWRPQGVPLS